uniref:Uncharacterized protein n=1 Tax=Timema poppense TaxID=170557 RepID=A0A7R9D724_TIMPO|nr:unnamed protein product [Timema poppensis]
MYEEFRSFSTKKRECEKGNQRLVKGEFVRTPLPSADNTRILITPNKYCESLSDLSCPSRGFWFMACNGRRGGGKFSSSPSPITPTNV